MYRPDGVPRDLNRNNFYTSAYSRSDRWHDSEFTPLLGGQALSSYRHYSSLIMEKVRDSKVSRKLNRLAVPSPPGLTNAQLMLQNEDLKPVEPERRVWTSKNFIFFWISDSVNISMFLCKACMLNLTFDLQTLG